MKGKELLGYALIHCETDLALFHRDHVRELYVKDLVAKARARL